MHGFATLPIIILLLVVSIAGIGLYTFSTHQLIKREGSAPPSISLTSPKPTLQSTATQYSERQAKKPSVHLADDPNISIEEIKIMAILFIPKDVNPPQDDRWRNLAQDWNKDVISFWEDVLDHKSTITFEALPQTFRGEKNAGEYDYNGVYQELWPQILNNSLLSPYLSGQKDELLTLFVYVLSDDQHFYRDYGRATHHFTQGSTFGLFIGSMDHKFELLDRSRGGIPAEEAHELGHALGLQHSTDDPNLVAKYLKGNVWTSACDLMIGSKIEGNASKSYTQNKDWDNAKTLQELDCIIPEQKKLFFNP